MANQKDVENWIKSLTEDGKMHTLTLDGGLRVVSRPPRKPFYQYRYTNLEGKQKEINLKSCEKIKLKVAENTVSIFNAKLLQGIDPQAELREQKAQAKRDSFTIAEMMNDFFNLPKVKNQKSFNNYRSTGNKHIIKKIGKLSAAKWTTPQALKFLRAIRDDYATTPKFVLNMLKRAYKNAILAGKVENSPVQLITPSDLIEPIKKRNRFLTEQEAAHVLSYADSRSRRRGLMLRLFLTLAVRKMELLAARWDEFDLDNEDQPVWYLPAERTKTNTAIRIPLPPLAVQWLRELKQYSGDSAYVCPAENKGKSPHLSRKPLNTFLANVPPPEWVDASKWEKVEPHDLRRTARTFLAKLRVITVVAELCLNHKVVMGVQEHYLSQEIIDTDYFKERAEALVLLSEKIAQLAGDNVIHIDAAKA